MTPTFPIQEDYSMREPIKQAQTYVGDPVEQWADGNWYFWDEVWTTAYGPFESEIKARGSCGEYSKTI